MRFSLEQFKYTHTRTHMCVRMSLQWRSDPLPKQFVRIDPWVRVSKTQSTRRYPGSLTQKLFEGLTEVICSDGSWVSLRGGKVVPKCNVVCGFVTLGGQWELSLDGRPLGEGGWESQDWWTFEETTTTRPLK